MARVAVLSDVHANGPALEAVLADIDRRGADEIWCGGDLVGQGPHPNEVVARIRKAGIPSVLGNQEVEVRTLAGKAPDRPERADPKKHMLWTIAVLTRRNRGFLLGLPPERTFTVEGRRVLLVHGSPRGVDDSMLPSLTSRTLDAWFPEDRPDVLVGGHSHVPFVRTVSGTLVVNSGTVGRPFDGDPRAGYALLDIGPARCRGSIRRVDYPVEQTIEAMARIGMRKWRRRALRLGMRRVPKGC